MHCFFMGVNAPQYAVPVKKTPGLRREFFYCVMQKCVSLFSGCVRGAGRGYLIFSLMEEVIFNAVVMVVRSVYSFPSSPA